MTADPTPVETAADEVYPLNGDDPTVIIAMRQAFVNGWRASRADLAQHRDVIARVLYLDDCQATDGIDDETAAAAWASLKPDGITRRAYRERAAAVLAYLTGEAS
jgi:hypothetical protein